MTLRKAVLFSYLVCGVLCLKTLRFPSGFKFGAASASYQIEGAWNVSDKSPSIWDVFLHTVPNATADGRNGDVTCDSYHLWRRDIEVASELGLHFYRFSINWPRLLPNGFSNVISEDGKKYYNNLINGLLEAGIEPMVTIYHWELPQILQDLGGWTNPLIADWFADYAKVVYTLFGDRVKSWLTVNEPIIFCDAAYNTGIFAPGIVDPDKAAYDCTKNLMIAHAKAWRIYDQEFKPKYHGEVSIANNFLWLEPKSDEDIELTKLAMDYNIGRFADPIFSKQGGWPASIEAVIANKSKAEGYPRSRLPSFTKEEIKLVQGTYDFMAVNYYFARQVRKSLPGEQLRPWPTGDLPDVGAILETDKWPAVYKLMPIYPEGFRYILRELKQRYGDIKIMITENGYADHKVGLEDDDRVKYYRDSLEQMLLAMNEDGVNVVGFTAWCMMDNFEWFSGYTTKFGLVEVNFTDPQRTRTLRKSARYYASIIKDHALSIQ